MNKNKQVSVTIIAFIAISILPSIQSTDLVAYFSQNGLHGEFHFIERADNIIEIQSTLETTLQFPEQVWEWSLHEMPIDYSNVNGRRRCHSTKIGTKIVDLTDHLDYIQLPGNESTTWTIPANILGTKSIWGKSLVLHDVYDGHFICATITTVEKNINYMAEARFHTPISGSIYFRWLSTRDSYHRTTLITSHLQHTHNLSDSSTPATVHSWKIYVTDILEAVDNRIEFNCDILQTIYDPKNRGRDLGRSPGDIDLRLGKLRVASIGQTQPASRLFQDNELMFFPNELTGPVRRQLFVVINDHEHTDRFLACARIRMIEPRTVRAVFNSNGIKGEVELHQPSIFEPTWLNFTVYSSKNELRENTEFVRDLAGYYIRDLPPDPVLFGTSEFCNSSRGIYNPKQLDDSNLPPPGYGTQDQYFVGDLTGKLQQRNKNYPHNYLVPSLVSTELNGIYWDVFLPLSGPNSVVHRGITIDRYDRVNAQNPTKSIWLCGTLMLYRKSTGYQLKMNTAQVFFKYPIVGRMLFRQPEDDPYQDTTVIVESLIHADGASQNTTENHRWAIHTEPPGKDFYNWTGRCLSTKHVFSPYKILELDQSSQACGANTSNCDSGYLVHRLGSLTIAGSRKQRPISRAMYTDANIPLTGPNSVIGRSMVIYDDFGPVARGERLACSMIETYLSRGAVASDWHGNGIPVGLRGKLEFYQQSEYEITNIDVNLKGLSEASGYHIHLAPVQSELEFPCEATTLNGRWKPSFVLSSNKTLEEQHELGDLSARFGTLDRHVDYKASFNDTNISLYGYQSILGRSIVVYKRDRNRRWACSSFDRSYNPKESREIRAIASFHNPKGYAYGYMRFRQLVHSSGSKSDTVIEVSLRHPGENNRNMTQNHHWKIFVNPVGVDAVVQQTVTRCVAGGYVWNPYYTQLADPLNTKLYKQECGPDNPLRCYVGDVSYRTDTIDLGGDRKVLYDSNFPLEGDQSALGRSIVIFGPNFSNERFACANIEPDHDIVKYVNIQKPPRFTLTEFLDEVRLFLNEPEWMLTVDVRKVAPLHNGACVQMLLHFRGPLAHRLEQAFSHLVDTGRVENYTPTISTNPKRKKMFSYRTCRNSNNKQGNNRGNN